MVNRRLFLLVIFAFFALTVVAQNSNQAPPVGGSGVKGHIPIWANNSALGNSKLYQSQTGEIGLGTTTPLATLDVSGTVSATSFDLGGNAFAFGSLASGNASLGFAGNSTMTGGDNTAVGALALFSNTSGPGNTAVGQNALGSNTSGYINTAIGLKTMFANTTGWDNVAVGINALGMNTTGNDNVVVGGNAAFANTTGYGNMVSGDYAMQHSSTGNLNTASGYYSLQYNQTGSNNTALGYNAGPDANSTNLTNSTAIGANAVVSQSNALVLGGTGVNAVNVGIGTATPSNVFTVAQGYGQAISDGWTTYSSRRWKANIATLTDALQTVEQLRGVSYQSLGSGKKEIGVIAEEVGKVVPEVVTYEGNGTDARGVDYSRLTALLIEAVKEQEVEIRQQREQLGKQEEQLRLLRKSLAQSPVASAQQ